jgi:hypothetical protein
MFQKKRNKIIVQKIIVFRQSKQSLCFVIQKTLNPFPALLGMLNKLGDSLPDSSLFADFAQIQCSRTLSIDPAHGPLPFCLGPDLQVSPRFGQHHGVVSGS